MVAYPKTISGKLDNQRVPCKQAHASDHPLTPLLGSSASVFCNMDETGQKNADNMSVTSDTSSDQLQDTHYQDTRLVQTSSSGQRSLPNSLMLDKLFKQTRKEFNMRRQSPIAPNLSKKRTLSQVSQTQNATHPNPENTWEFRKKFARNTSSSNQHTSSIVHEKNRFDSLNNISQETAFEYAEEALHKQQRRSELPAYTQHGYSQHAGSRRYDLPAAQDVAGAHAPYRAEPSETTTPEIEKDNKGNAHSKPSPIFTCDTTINNLVHTLKTAQLGKSDFHIKQNDANTHIIYCYNLTSFAKITTCLKTNKIKYYTYTPKSQKNKNIVLKGIRGTFSEADIKAEIDELNLTVKIVKITKILFDKNNKDAFHFLIQCSNDSNLQELTKIKNLAYQKIRWEHLRKKDTFQCTNCQRLGHSSSNCFLGYRCVKCKESHEPGKCDLKKNDTDRSALYCTNCDKAGHPASYRGCPYFRLAKDIKNTQKEARQNERENRFNDNTAHKAQIDKEINELTHSFQNKTINNESIVTFSDTNPAFNPAQPENTLLFCNTYSTHLIFKNLPNKTSSGLDSIPPIVLKHLPIQIIKDYAIIFNNCLNNKFYPKEWKQAKILPVLKKNKPATDITSYRPISLTPAISKVYEVVINNSLRAFTTKNNVLPDNQFGFRYELSTTHALHKIITHINSYLHKGQVVGACLVDLKTAFDSVWIHGLLYILLKLKSPIDLIQLIWSMTIDRTFVTYNGDSLSSLAFCIIEGLMQGTVNSPELFNIFTHNVPLLFGLNNNNNTHSVAFADDFIMLVADKDPEVIQTKLEDLLNRINKQYNLWNLRINPSKCETILFHKPLRFLTYATRQKIKNSKYLFSLTILTM